jgi:hypothetical protein
LFSFNSASFFILTWTTIITITNMDILKAMDLVDVDLMVIMTCHTCLTPIILDRHLVHITNTTITMIANMDAVMSTITTNNVTDIKEAIGGTVKKKH